MASITRTSNGHFAVQFVAPDRRRRTVRLGKVARRVAEEVRVRVEALAAAAASGLSVDRETAAWLAKIGDRLAARLAAVGLVPKRQARGAGKLGDFIDAYIARRTDAKPGTLSNLRMFGDRLIAFFGRDKDLADVKRSDADDWLLFLKREYAPATVGRTVKGARQLFKAACRAELVARNPFEDLTTAGNPDKDRQHFVSLDVARRVIDACPDAEWRLLVALARYGGLRCPTEILGLTWAGVDWQRERFLVKSPKTEHHEGKGERWVPIFPELRPHLADAFDQAEPGALHLITRYRDTNQNLRTQLNRIIRKAGLVPWPKPFQNMRASRETELAAAFPLHVVVAWIGNSTLIAHKHYLQTTEEDFRRAAAQGAGALQKAVQQDAAPARTEPQPVTAGSDNSAELRPGATGCKSMLDRKIRPAGFEPATLGLGNRCSIP